MSRKPRRELAVGSFAALALLVLALAIMSVGTDSDLFVRANEYRVVFPETAGLRVGSPVKLAGVQVGTVREIALPTTADAEGIRVLLAVESRFARRVRTDSTAEIRFLQLVSGEKYVELTAGSAEAGPLPPGSTIEVAPSTEFLEQGADIASNLLEVTAALREILRPLREGEGLLGELVHDPEFGKEGLARLRETLDNLAAITGDLEAGRGFVGRALSDRELAARVDDLAAALVALRDFTEALARREGALGAVLEDDGAAERAIVELEAAAASLRRTAEALERREGLFGRLVHDTEWSEGVARDLRDTLRHTAAIARKIDEGEGTLGALVNERLLHDGMEQVVAGVDDSKFARWLIKHYRKKGIKLEDVHDSAPDDDAP